MDPDPDPGGPKTCGSGGSRSGFGSGSATLKGTVGEERPYNEKELYKLYSTGQ